MKSRWRAWSVSAVAGISIVVPALAGCAGVAVDTSAWAPEATTDWGTITLGDEEEDGDLEGSDYLDYEDDPSADSGSGDWIGYDLTCLSVVDGVSPHAAVEGIVDSDLIEFPDRDGAEEWIWDGYDTDPDALRVWVASGTVDGHTFVWEGNGFDCDDARKAARLSKSGSFVSMYWNIDASTNFIFAQNGQLTTEFDPLGAPDAATWSVLEAHGGEHVSDDAWWDAGSEQSALVLQAQLMGLSGPADLSWLDDPSVEFWGYSY